MEILDKKIRNFLLLPHHNSYGDGDGNGYGDGRGGGYGYGCGEGRGGGYGDGRGGGYGDGDGDGGGYGYGCGYGCGYGDGDGDGDGGGYGYGCGYGCGYGDGNGSGYSGGGGYGGSDGGGGVKNINGDTIYNIDSIQTIILSIRGNIAKGYILNKYLTLSPCYVVKNDYFFAHGSSIKEALEALEEKTTSELPIPQRIKIFKSQFKDFNVKVKAQLLYDWHHKLTGSCKMGRDSFCTNNNINLKKDKLTVDEFIELTKKEYGGEIIKQLKNKT